MRRAGAHRDAEHMRLALRLARRALGFTSPNPLVGAVLVKDGRILGQGWHHHAGASHAEIEALRDAQRHGHKVAGATLFVTLEPCSTCGRTPPCTEAILHAGVKRVVASATDPNPAHAGRGFDLLRQAGVTLETGLLEKDASDLNKSFNHWIVHRTPWVVVKAAMTLDGKIATATGESKWITGERARAAGMRLRKQADAILTGVNTILADDPGLTCRRASGTILKPLRRIILDSRARTPLNAKVVSDSEKTRTTVVVTAAAPARRVKALASRARVMVAPSHQGRVDLDWLLAQLGLEEVTSLLVEGGGEVNASFLLERRAHEVAFFFAPKVLGGRRALKGVAGRGIATMPEAIRLRDVRWRSVGEDWLLRASLG